MRYIIHLLPEAAQRAALDDLRARIAAVIGPNRALDYPTAHVTLVWSIVDRPADAAPIDSRALAALLDAHCGGGPISLTIRSGERMDGHALLPLDDTPALASLRNDLVKQTRAIVADPRGRQHERAGRVREQPWPHLTLAQEIEPERWARAMALIAAERAWVYRPIVGAELALVARDVAAGQPYRIIHRAAL